MSQQSHIQELRSKLEALRTHLESSEHMDSQSRSLLNEVTSEIDAALNEEDPERLGSDTFNDRLVAAARDFESHHPAFSRTLESIVDILGQMGI